MSAALLVAAGVGIWFAWPKPGPQNPNNFGPAPGPPRPTTSSPSTNSKAQLLNSLPTGYGPGVCNPRARVQGALATVDCGQNSDPGGPTIARYSLFATDTALQNAFNASVKGEDQLSLCPGTDAVPDTWYHTATPNEVAGGIACGTYHNNAILTWTNESTLVLADVQAGPQGPTIDQLYTWWTNHS